ncbi:hypothetical protein EsH8_IV_001067 [Colletotrichum jinshuiense]
MRLLNVTTRRLEEFFNDIPNYAILSHTWGKDEVTLQDLDRPEHASKRAYAKVDGVCSLAMRDGYNFVWVDTCCIDKTSSAELSEAINSMFQWYADASVCYAYLEDVHKGNDPAISDSQFRRSRWFTRGWTLQELLAPRRVEFYNSAWLYVGDCSLLSAAIESITGIPESYLQRGIDFRTATIAVRMGWAANRETTRKEDRSYSLLGIFGVNMTLLYGEGDRAFERLQLKIMERSTDNSILAWGLPQTLVPSFMGWNYEGTPSDLVNSLPSRFDTKPHGVLARRLEDFVASLETSPVYEIKSVTEMTNRGLRITLPLLRMEAQTYGILNFFYRR